jgi:hypothetical protein
VRDKGLGKLGVKDRIKELVRRARFADQEGRREAKREAKELRKLERAHGQIRRVAPANRRGRRAAGGRVARGTWAQDRQGRYMVVTGRIGYHSKMRGKKGGSGPSAKALERRRRAKHTPWADPSHDVMGDIQEALRA